MNANSIFSSSDLSSSCLEHFSIIPCIGANTELNATADSNTASN